MIKINNLENVRIVIQRKALGIYEETKDITQEQAIQAIYEKIISLSCTEVMEIENNEELQRASCSINIDILRVILQNIEKIEPEQYTTLSDIKKDTIHLVKISRISESNNYVGRSKEDKIKISQR